VCSSWLYTSFIPSFEQIAVIIRTIKRALSLDAMHGGKEM
jgi:hypothetical protein